MFGQNRNQCSPGAEIRNLAQAGIKLAKIGCDLAVLAKDAGIRLNPTGEQSQPSNSQPIPSHPNFESTEMMPFLFHDRSSPIPSASARTAVTDVKDDELNEMGYSS